MNFKAPTESNSESLLSSEEAVQNFWSLFQHIIKKLIDLVYWALSYTKYWCNFASPSLGTHFLKKNFRYGKTEHKIYHHNPFKCIIQ